MLVCYCRLILLTPCFYFSVHLLSYHSTLYHLSYRHSRKRSYKYILKVPSGVCSLLLVCGSECYEEYILSKGFCNWKARIRLIWPSYVDIYLTTNILFWHSEDRASWYIIIMKANKCTVSQLYFGKELCMFRTDLLSIIRSLNTVYTAIGICPTGYVDWLLARLG
jgi:hypothetical protein